MFFLFCNTVFWCKNKAVWQINMFNLKVKFSWFTVYTDAKLSLANVRVNSFAIHPSTHNHTVHLSHITHTLTHTSSRPAPPPEPRPLDYLRQDPSVPLNSIDRELIPWSLGFRRLLSWGWHACSCSHFHVHDYLCVCIQWSKVTYKDHACICVFRYLCECICKHVYIHTTSLCLPHNC